MEENVQSTASTVDTVKSDHNHIEVEKKSNRIEWVDIVKYFCIIFVMLSHLDSCTGVWRAFFTPFFLTAFLFVSGYVYKPKQNFGTFIYKKFRQLFIPWLIFSVLNILLSQIISFNEQAGLLEELKWNFLQIRGKEDGLWFIAALFVAFVPFYFVVKIYECFKLKVKRGWVLCGLTILVMLSLYVAATLYSRLMPADMFPWQSNSLPWHIVEYIFVANFFMTLGYLFRTKFEKYFDKVIKLWVIIITYLFYLLIVYIPYFLQVSFPIAIDIIFEYISQFVGITVIVLVSKAIKTNRYFSYVGQNTLIYFAFHGKVLSLIQVILERFASGIYASILGNIVFSSIFALCLSLLISLILIIPAYIINRWLPFIIGRPWKKKKMVKESN